MVHFLDIWRLKNIITLKSMLEVTHPVYLCLISTLLKSVDPVAIVWVYLHSLLHSKFRKNLCSYSCSRSFRVIRVFPYATSLVENMHFCHFYALESCLKPSHQVSWNMKFGLWATRWWKLHDPMSICVYMVPACIRPRSVSQWNAWPATGRSTLQDLRSCAILQASLALSPVSSSICCTHVQQGRPRWHFHSGLMSGLLLARASTARHSAEWAGVASGRPRWMDGLHRL